MLVEVFSRLECPSCEKIKNRFNSMGIEYREHIVDVNCTREYVKENFPGKNILPIVVAAGQVYSGLPAVELALNEYKENFGKEMLLETERFENEGGQTF